MFLVSDQLSQFNYGMDLSVIKNIILVLVFNKKVGFGFVMCVWERVFKIINFGYFAGWEGLSSKLRSWRIQMAFKRPMPKGNMASWRKLMSYDSVWHWHNPSHVLSHWQAFIMQWKAEVIFPHPIILPFCLLWKNQNEAKIWDLC